MTRNFRDALPTAGCRYRGEGSVCDLLRPCCSGDLDGDFDTDSADLGLLLQSWQTSALGDLDGDGDTDESDLGLLLQDWGCALPRGRLRERSQCRSDIWHATCFSGRR